jgi:hypothetical protein
MNAEYLGGNDGCDGKTVEDVYERFPRLDIRPPFAFIVKAIYCETNQNSI